MLTPQPSKLPEPSSDVSSWTNTDVLVWLLKTDQKLFVPAFCTNNVTGALLMQLDLHAEDGAQEGAPSGRRLADFVAGAPPAAIAGLVAQLEVLMRRGSDDDKLRGWSMTVSTRKVRGSELPSTKNSSEPLHAGPGRRTTSTRAASAGPHWPPAPPPSSPLSSGRNAKLINSVRRLCFRSTFEAAHGFSA